MTKPVFDFSQPAPARTPTAPLPAPTRNAPPVAPRPAYTGGEGATREAGQAAPQFDFSGPAQVPAFALPSSADVVTKFAGSEFGKVAIPVLTTAGKVLQPFMAPQQVLFGGISWAQLASQGKYKEAGESFKQGLGAAGDYLTWGFTARENWLNDVSGGRLGGDAKDARKTYISGYTLAKQAGMPDYVAKPLGLAADFLLDVPLIGYLGKLAKVDEALDVTLSINRLSSANMAHAFTHAADGSVDVTGLKKFAIRVAATPFSTAPIHDLVTGLPLTYRKRLAETAAGMIEANRSTLVRGGAQSARNEQLGGTVATSLISKFGGVKGLPRMEGEALINLKAGKLTGTGVAKIVEKRVYQMQSEIGSVSWRSQQAQTKYQDLVGDLKPAVRDEFHKIAYKILDWDSPAQYHRGLAELAAFSTRIGRPTFTDDALKSLWESSALDTYMGFLRFKTGTYEAEKVSGNYQGLRRLERTAFGQPKTENPMASRFAADALAVRNSPRPTGRQIPDPADPTKMIDEMAPLRPILPQTALHFRRSYNLHFQPYDTIHQVEAQRLPGMLHQVNEKRLGGAFTAMLATKSLNMGYTPQDLLRIRPQQEAEGARLAADLSANFLSRNVNERVAIASTLLNNGYQLSDLRMILRASQDDMWGTMGVAYRPIYTKVMEKLENMSVDARVTESAAAQGTEVGTNRAVLQAREDMPDWLMESMGQTYDIARLLDESVRIGTKQYEGRSITQMTHDFLKSEDAIMTSEEFARIPNAHTNWRRVDVTLANKLKAMGDSHGGSLGDLPFKGDEYIPAAYHELLVSATKIDEYSVLGASLQMLMQAWKAHKVGNVPSIIRDTLTNYRFASDFGIRPDQLTRAVVAGLQLTTKATEGGLAARVRGAKPDVLNETASIRYNGVDISMKEISDMGGMMHGSFLVNELREPHRRLTEALASRQGNTMQKVTAAFVDFSEATRTRLQTMGGMGEKAAKVTATGTAAVVDAATGLGGPITKMLGDLKGNTDVIFKLGVYMHKRGEGMAPVDAQRYADELLFNYQNQPMMVDFLRKNGISPFAAFQFMSTGRFIKTLYENPYAVARWYRLPSSATQGDEATAGELQYTAPDYMRRQLWVPLFNMFDFRGDKKDLGKAKRDSEQRSMWFNLASVMPESTVFSLTGTDVVSQWIPPYVELAMQIVSGQGYQGTPVYGGKGSLSEVLESGDKLAAVQGIIEQLHTFGASPWVPGTPQAERMAKALVNSLVPEEQVAGDPGVQAFLALAQRGVFSAPLQEGPIVPQRTGGAAPLDIPYAFGRAVGFTTSPVTGYAGVAGSARGNLQGEKYEIENLKRRLRNAVMDGGSTPEAVAAATRRYLPLIAEKAAKVREMAKFTEEYKFKYEMENPR